jgi:hypothetical protein
MSPSSLSSKDLASIHVDSSSLSCHLGRLSQRYLHRYSSYKYLISKRCLSSTLTIMRMSIFLKTGRVRTSWNSQCCSLDTLNSYAQSLRGGIRQRVFHAINDKSHVGVEPPLTPVQSRSDARLRCEPEQRWMVNLRCRSQAPTSPVYDIANT